MVLFACVSLALLAVMFRRQFLTLTRWIAGGVTAGALLFTAMEAAEHHTASALEMLAFAGDAAVVWQGLRFMRYAPGFR
jgi:hypothetical protein